ncbi:MAG: hypothetical protein Q8R28_01820 [Dehalococcoidia bacterium]|nr:hypothetical protein [Dehalococcoidia bacterium]
MLSIDERKVGVPTVPQRFTGLIAAAVAGLVADLADRNINPVTVPMAGTMAAAAGVVVPYFLAPQMRGQNQEINTGYMYGSAGVLGHQAMSLLNIGGKIGRVRRVHVPAMQTVRADHRSFAI